MECASPAEMPQTLPRTSAQRRIPESARPSRAGGFATLAAPLALCLAGICLILIATARYGVGLTPDSACYISVARNLVAGNGLIPDTSVPFVEWPPLFPLLLALAAWLGLDPIVAARLLNALAFGLILLVSSLWMQRNIRSRLLALTGSVAVLLAVPVQEV